MAGPEPTSVQALRSTPFPTGMGIALGGIFVCLANTLVTKAGILVGVSVAFPVCMGAGLVGGSAINFAMQPDSSTPEWLFAGIAFAAVGSFLGGVAERVSPYVPQTKTPTASTSGASLPDSESGECFKPGHYVAVHDGLIVSQSMSKASEELSALEKNTVLNVQEVFCSVDQDRIRAHITEPIDGWISLMTLSSQYGFVKPYGSTSVQASSVSFIYRVSIFAAAGLLSALWSPAATWFIVGGGVDAFTSIFYFNLGQLATVVVQILTHSNWHPLNSLASVWQSARAATWRQHGLCFSAGLLNVSGLLCNFLAGSASSFAQAFGVAMCAPVITTAIGIVALGELKGRTCLVKLIIGAMCCFYLGGIACIANSGA